MRWATGDGRRAMGDGRWIEVLRGETRVVR